MTAACRNPAHTSPAGYCDGCARDCEAELTALNDRYMRLLGGLSDERRRTYAAARREAQDNIRGTIYRTYLPAIVAELMPDVRPALYRATQVDPAWARTAHARAMLDTLRGFAIGALAAWDKRTSRTGLDADAARDPSWAETTRLRAVITAHGQRLHRAADAAGQIPHPAPPGWTCPCEGCELIRDMDWDGLGVPGPEAAA